MNFSLTPGFACPPRQPMAERGTAGSSLRGHPRRSEEGVRMGFFHEAPRGPGPASAGYFAQMSLSPLIACSSLRTGPPTPAQKPGACSAAGQSRGFYSVKPPRPGHLGEDRLDRASADPRVTPRWKSEGALCLPVHRRANKMPLFSRRRTESEQKYCAPCEDRTHDLQIMRLTRYLLR